MGIGTRAAAPKGRRGGVDATQWILTGIVFIASAVLAVGYFIAGVSHLLASPAPNNIRDGLPEASNPLALALAACSMFGGVAVLVGCVVVMQYWKKSHTWDRRNLKEDVVSGLFTLPFTVPFALMNFKGVSSNGWDIFSGLLLIAVGIFAPAIRPRKITSDANVHVRQGVPG